MTERETWEEALQYGKSMFGRVDVVINNAGERNDSAFTRKRTKLGNHRNNIRSIGRENGQLKAKPAERHSACAHETH